VEQESKKNNQVKELFSSIFAYDFANELVLELVHMFWVVVSNVG
jgi:hypothetical protein